MRISFCHIPRQSCWQTLSLVCQGESLGYDRAWLPEQTLHRDPYSLLGACALRTHAIGLGLGVANPYTVHPAVTARAAATLSELAGGRFVLALGTGNQREYIGPLGFSTECSHQRLQEALQVIRHLLSREVVSFTGEHFRLEGVRLQMDSFPPVPVYVAGIGPKTLEVAGELSDGVILHFASTAGILFGREQVSRGARRKKRDVEALSLVAWVLCVLTGDREGGYDLVRPFVAHTLAPASKEVVDAVGVSRKTWREVREAFRQGASQQAACLIQDETCENWAVIGEAEACVDRLQALASTGIDEIALVPWSPTWEGMTRMIREIGEKVLPKLSGRFSPDG